MAQINVAILGAGRIAQSMAETLVKMAADDRYRDLVAPYAVAARDGEAPYKKPLKNVVFRCRTDRMRSLSPIRT